MSTFKQKENKFMEKILLDLFLSTLFHNKLEISVEGVKKALCILNVRPHIPLTNYIFSLSSMEIQIWLHRAMQSYIHVYKIV